MWIDDWATLPPSRTMMMTTQRLDGEAVSDDVDDVDNDRFVVAIRTDLASDSWICAVRQAAADR